MHQQSDYDKFVEKIGDSAEAARQFTKTVTDPSKMRTIRSKCLECKDKLSLIRDCQNDSCDNYIYRWAEDRPAYGPGHFPVDA